MNSVPECWKSGKTSLASVSVQLVEVADVAAPPDDLGAVAGRGEHRLALGVDAAEQRGHRHGQRLGEPGEAGQAARRLGVLDLGQHGLAHAGQPGELGQ
jgi:hypothetical protein